MTIQRKNKEKSPEDAGLFNCQEIQKQRLNLCFFEFYVLSELRVILLHNQLFRQCAGILFRYIEVSRIGSALKPYLYYCRFSHLLIP